MESPFDTGVARRVKRAYSSLDSVGVRIGVFLRRYPLARIFILIYIVSSNFYLVLIEKIQHLTNVILLQALLQFWVLIVLFSQSPEAR